MRSTPAARSIPQVRAQLEAAAARLAQQYPKRVALIERAANLLLEEQAWRVDGGIAFADGAQVVRPSGTCNDAACRVHTFCVHELAFQLAILVPAAVGRTQPRGTGVILRRAALPAQRTPPAQPVPRPALAIPTQRPAPAPVPRPVDPPMQVVRPPLASPTPEPTTPPPPPIDEVELAALLAPLELFSHERRRLAAAVRNIRYPWPLARKVAVAAQLIGIALDCESA